MFRILLTATVVLALVSAQCTEEEAQEEYETQIESDNSELDRTCGELNKGLCKKEDAKNSCPCTCEIMNSKGGGKKGGGGGGGGNGCFAGDALVQTQQYGQLEMRELASFPDARVLSADADGRLEFAPVTFWLHLDAALEAAFHELRTAGGRQLALTDNHLVYRTDCAGKRETVFAQEVREGQCLLVDADGQLVEERVVATALSRKRGVYSPVTTNGNLVVDGVLASSYSNFKYESLMQLATNVVVRLQSVLPSRLYELVLNMQPGQSATHEIPNMLFNMFHLSKIFV